MKKIVTLILLASLTAGAFALPNLLKKEQFGAGAIEDLNIDLAWENLEIKESYDTSSIDVEIYCNYKKFAPEVSVSGSALEIESSKRHRGFFSTPTGLTCTVIIYLPQKKDFDEVEIEVSSADIVIESVLSAKDEIVISSTSGEIISKNGLFADTVEVSSSSGDIDLYNVDADKFIVSATSGDITLRKFTGGTGEITSTSGDIKADDFASEYADFESTSVSIYVKKLDCDYFDAQNTSGGISLELINEPIASSSVECSSGDINIYLPMRAKFSIDVSCSSGTFRDKFNNNRLSPRDEYCMDYNGGGSVIKLRTSSGDVSLDY